MNISWCLVLEILLKFIEDLFKVYQLGILENLRLCESELA
jgi:hypothetical protein